MPSFGGDKLQKSNGSSSPTHRLLGLEIFLREMSSKRVQNHDSIFSLDRSQLGRLADLAYLSSSSHGFRRETSKRDIGHDR